MLTERIPFDVAISDPKILKKHWDTLSKPQQTVLKAYNGLPLDDEKDHLGFSELDYWSMFQGQGVYDELGYLRSVTRVPYEPKQYHTLVAILGRRSGKTDRITATQMAYEAILGGHSQYVEPGQDFKIYFVAQDIPTAAGHLNFVYNALRSSPLLLREVVKFNQGVLELTNGLTIEPAPPTIESPRGKAVPGWCGDEVGFWYTDSKAANPDFEVERAMEYSMLQFPDAFKFITSTPWTKEGMLWKYHLAGTEGSKLPRDQREEHIGVLVVHAPTAAMDNPRFRGPKGRARLARLQKRDPDAFARESLAQFVDSISGFLKPEILRAAVDTGVIERPRYPRPDHPEDPTPYYVAAMDPAFRHDNFAFTIMHHDRELGIVQDYFKEWVPEVGAPLNPKVVLDEIKLKMDEFGLSAVYSDQYQLEALQQIALDMGFSIVGVDFTSSSKAKIYGSFATLVNTKRMRLLDDPSVYDQLVSLEKKRTPHGVVQISGPPGKKDDAAAACALCAHQCVWLLPAAVSAKPKPKTHTEEGWEQILRKRALQKGEFSDEFDEEDFSDEFDDD